MAAENKVTPIGKDPARVTPEMLIRWLMGNMDRVQALAIMVKLDGQHPTVTVSDSCSQYFLALASSVFARESLKGLSQRSGYPPSDPPKETA